MADLTAETKKAFGAWLIELRERSPFDTQEDVAREMGRRWNSRVTGSQISDYERGVNSPDGRRFWELLAIYGVTYEAQPAIPTPEPQARLGAMEEKLDSLLAAVGRLERGGDENVERLVAAIRAVLLEGRGEVGQ